MSTAAQLVPVQLLLPGQRGCVEQLVGATDDVRRLEELGLRASAEIVMVDPGNPCVVKLGGHKLCLRGGEAFQIFVRPGEFA